MVKRTLKAFLLLMLVFMSPLTIIVNIGGASDVDTLSRNLSNVTNVSGSNLNETILPSAIEANVANSGEKAENPAKDAHVDNTSRDIVNNISVESSSGNSIDNLNVNGSCWDLDSSAKSNNLNLPLLTTSNESTDPPTVHCGTPLYNDPTYLKTMVTYPATNYTDSCVGDPMNTAKTANVRGNILAEASLSPSPAVYYRHVMCKDKDASWNPVNPTTIFLPSDAHAGLLMTVSVDTQIKSVWYYRHDDLDDNWLYHSEAVSSVTPGAWYVFHYLPIKDNPNLPTYPRGWLIMIYLDGTYSFDEYFEITDDGGQSVTCKDVVDSEPVDLADYFVVGEDPYVYYYLRLYYVAYYSWITDHCHDYKIVWYKPDGNVHAVWGPDGWSDYKDSDPTYDYWYWVAVWGNLVLDASTPEGWWKIETYIDTYYDEGEQWYLLTTTTFFIEVPYYTFYYFEFDQNTGGAAQKTVYANLYGQTSDGNFEIYYDKNDPHIGSTYLSYVEDAAVNSWSVLTPFLGSSYDQDGDGRIEILIVNLNKYDEISAGGGVIGYVQYPDANGLGLIYLDNNIDVWLSWNWLKAAFSHEFTHRIQYTYRRGWPRCENWLAEGTAQFGGDYAWPFSIHQGYVNTFQKYPDTQLNYCGTDSSLQYRSWYCAAYVFFEYIAERFGVSSIKQILNKWVTYDGIEAVPNAVGVSMNDLFNEFASKNYVNDYTGTATTFEGIDIYAEPIASYTVPPSRSGSDGTMLWATDYVKFVTSKTWLKISFEGDSGRAYYVWVIKVIGDFVSYSIDVISLSKNRGAIKIPNANTYSQLALTVTRHQDSYTSSSWDYTAEEIIVYDATIKAYCETEGVDVSVSFTWDGTPYTTPKTFEGQTGSHTVVIAEKDANNHPFKKWLKDGIEYSTSRTITVSTAGTYTAIYLLEKCTVTFYTDPSEDSSITFDGATYTDGQSDVFEPGTYTATANPAECYEFDHWESGENVVVTDPNVNPTSVEVRCGGWLKAVFRLVECEVTFYTEPTDPSFNITFNGKTYTNNQTEIFYCGTSGLATANAPKGWNFSYWIVGGNVYLSDNKTNPTTITIKCGGTLTAVFKPIAECEVTLYTDPTDVGSITFEGKTYTNGESNSFKNGTSSSATANAPECWVFDRWLTSGNVSVSDDYTNPTTFTIHCGGNLTAVFKRIQCGVTFYTNPSNGSITFNGTTYTNSQSDIFDCGTSGPATAHPPESWNFSHWIVSGNIYVSDDRTNPTNVTIKCGGNLTAVFAKETLVYVDPSEIVGPPPNVGENSTWTLRVDTVSDLYLWTLDLSWDPSVLELQGTPIEGNCLKCGGSTTFLWESITPGRITGLTCTLLGTLPGVDVPPCPNDLANVTFKVLNYTCSLGTWITISDSHLLDHDGNEIPHATQPAKITLCPTDLTVSSMTVQYDRAYFYANVTDGCHVNVNITNVGNAEAGPFNVTFTVTWMKGMILEYNNKTLVTSLAKGETTTRHCQFTIRHVGNYSVTAMVDSDFRIPESDEDNNTSTRIVRGRGAGDINGDDTVDYHDLFRLARAYGSEISDPNWDPDADIDCDGKVGYQDLFLLAKNYGKIFPDP